MGQREGSDLEDEQDADVEYDVNGSVERSLTWSPYWQEPNFVLIDRSPSSKLVGQYFARIRDDSSLASKMVISFDHNSASTSNTGHEGDEGWENVQFDMEMDDVYENVLSESTTMSVHVHADKTKHAYADIVKRV
ncbi:hypothetical protein PIIN_02912 [Serendipita indica DSM 11827]|uniref:Uncharacterized protein n=1 Tax=Serendipita indica (strain DSM 11827) TaxID=1109443 RepID=G4TCL0_SERID|nr:hypothetical protein PIIN_02912 [Serendipita indica DSM 11827]